MNVVIIGATFGIGYELGKKYLDQCDNLILLGRTQEKLKNLKEMNISYNMFNGFVSRNLAKLDTLNMTMINEQGVATTLKVSIDKNSAYAADE